MHFTNASNLLALLPFTSFLVKHIDEIHPKVVVFLFDRNQHRECVDQIVGALDGRHQMRFIQVATGGKPNRTIIHDDALLLSFMEVCHDIKWTQFTSVVRTFVIKIRDNNAVGSNASASFFYMDLPLGLYMCIHWSPSIRNVENGAIEDVFVRSFAWFVFSDRVRTLPKRMPLSCTDDLLTDRVGFKNRVQDVLIITGFRIGIYKILGELLEASYMRYFYTIQFDIIHKEPIAVTVRDRRLIATFFISSKEKFPMISLSPHWQLFPYQFSHGALQTRYMIVVPRIVMDSNSNRSTEYWSKFLVIVGLFLCTAFFVVIRYLCQVNDGDELPVNAGAWIMQSFFDTLARTLSVGAGQWMGRSTAERQMLTVIAIFAILSGSIFSGVLYEQLLVKEEVRFRLNSLDDICLAGMVLNVPRELIPGYSYVNQDMETGELFLQ